jgi:hypothetical protein
MDLARIDQLIRQVPRPPETELPVGCSDADINEFEGRTGLSIPNQLRDWLKQSNGSLVGPGGLFGIQPCDYRVDIERDLSFYPQWASLGYIPVAGDGCGNYYVAVTNRSVDNGVIAFIDTMSDPDRPGYAVASDTEHFLVFLLEQELGERFWPFDREKVVAADPAIENVTTIPLPWSKSRNT